MLVNVYKKALVGLAVPAVALAALSACSSASSDDSSSSKEFTLEDNPLRGTTITGTFQPDWGLPLAAMDGGKPTGYIIELVEAAAAKIGAKIKVVPNDFATTIPGVQSGKYDIGNGTDATVDRQKVVDVVATVKSGYTFLTYKGSNVKLGSSLDDLCGLRVSQIAGNSVLDALNAQAKVCESKNLGELKILTFPDQAAALLAVQSGRADTTSKTLSSAGFVAKQDPRWTVTGPQVSTGESGFSLKKGTGQAKLWASAVDAIIADGTYDAILKKYNIEQIALKHSDVNPAS